MIGIDDIIIGVIIGAAIGGATAAATGGNIGLGILTGAIGGLFGGLGAWAGSTFLASTFGEFWGGVVGGVAGGAAGGAVSAAAVGGNVGMGALTGAIAAMIGFGVGWANREILDEFLSDFSVSVIGGTLGGGVGAELQGGSFGEGAKYGAMGAAIGAAVVRLPSMIRILSENWVQPPIAGSPKVPESLATDMKNVRNMENPPNRVWWKNGMHAWHAGSMAALASRLGPLAAPFLWLAGVYHETPFDWNSFKAEQHFQGTLNHFLDSLTDIAANTYGILVGNLLSPSAAVPFAVRTGNYIPGPGETDPAYGGNGPYNGNPFTAWGKYP